MWTFSPLIPWYSLPDMFFESPIFSSNFKYWKKTFSTKLKLIPELAMFFGSLSFCRIKFFRMSLDALLHKLAVSMFKCMCSLCYHHYELHLNKNELNLFHKQPRSPVHHSSSNMLQRCLESQADSFFNHSEKLLWVMFVLLFFRFKILDFWYLLLMTDLHLAPWALYHCSLNLLQTLHCDISLDSVICHRLLFHGFSLFCWITS